MSKANWAKVLFLSYGFRCKPIRNRVIFMAEDSDAILVVEDEEEARNFLVRILEFEGFTAIGLSNGAAALDYLQKSAQPSLIVLDMRMPIMDGPQFRSALLRDPRLMKIPIVIVTAMDPAAATGLSAVRVFRKPLDVDALLLIVRQTTARQ
ncbi:MAG: response regulator [Candidatus Binataceae bacterium]